MNFEPPLEGRLPGYQVLRLHTTTLEDLPDHWSQIEASLEQQEGPFRWLEPQPPPKVDPLRSQNFVWKIEVNAFAFSDQLRALMAQSYRQQYHHNVPVQAPSPHNHTMATPLTVVAQPSTINGTELAGEAPPPPSACHTYVTPKVPLAMRNLAQQIVQAVTHQVEETPGDTLHTTTALQHPSDNRTTPDYGHKDGHGDKDDDGLPTRRQRPWRIGLHIRRGDAKDLCDTNLERMRSYLNCSLVQPLLSSLQSQRLLEEEEGLPDKTGPPVERLAIIYFYSDERDKEYRMALGQMVQEGLIQGSSAASVYHFVPRIQFVDLDRFIFFHLRDGGEPLSSPTTLEGNQTRQPTSKDLKAGSGDGGGGRSNYLVPPYKRANNYFLFRLEQVVLKELQLTGVLEQRRTDICNDCDPIAF